MRELSYPRDSLSVQVQHTRTVVDRCQGNYAPVAQIRLLENIYDGSSPSICPSSKDSRTYELESFSIVEFSSMLPTSPGFRMLVLAQLMSISREEQNSQRTSV